MIDLKNKYECCGCFACKNICPVNAIEMVEDEQKFKYPQINKELCINCGLCEKVCPIINNKTKDVQDLPKAYAVYNKDEQIRKESSSGGIFTVIAKFILNRNGIVFGAAFDDNFNVHHVEVDNENMLYKLRGSKYIQSDIDSTYKSVKNYLDNNQLVFFTGTPCQIEGLYAYLGKNYENLYTQDLICHGVPSKIAWEKYLEYRRKEDNGGKIIDISFRDKFENGWSKYGMSIKYKNKTIKINHDEDLFMKMFLKDIILRPSCYDCKFKKINRVADITLADFWGINKIAPELNDENGISLMIVHSKKALEILENLKSNLELKEINYYDGIRDNQNMIKSANIEKYRPDFYKDCQEMSMTEIENKYLK